MAALTSARFLMNGDLPCFLLLGIDVDHDTCDTGGPAGSLSLNSVAQMLFDFGYGVLREIFVEFANDPTLHVGMKR